MKRFTTGISNYFHNYAKYRTRDVLMQLSDTQLQDVGISRALLQRGVTAWPWRVTDEDNTVSYMPTKPEIKVAVRDLQSMTDRELLDIGVTRGDIQHAVSNGMDRRRAA